MANSPDLSNITNLAISTINKLFMTNPVWLGIPVRYSSSIYVHNMIAGFSYGLPSKRLLRNAYMKDSRVVRKVSKNVKRMKK